jgi:2-polyprenyl-6-methoxyphenol hydroxylase-like FAD-dependent oxidoreductase
MDGALNLFSSTSAEPQEVPVLIVGGSMIGLAVALFLAQHGVRCVSVERHRGTAIHPRAGHFQLRTLELMRAAGIEEQVRAAALALYDPDGGINAVETLAGRELAQYIPNLNAGIDDVSPSRRLFMPQQVLEPMLLDRARQLGAQFSYARELTDFLQDADGVTATMRQLDSGAERPLRARYLVACDGHRSPVRERLGIAMRGHGLLSHSITIYFRADCSHALRGRNLGVIYVDNAQLRGFFRLERTGQAGFLVVFTVGDIRQPGARRAADDIDEAKARSLVRAAVGEPQLDVKIEDIARWRAVADVAERFSDGRIFIVGDAAHTMPPTGGYGGNTGLQDAHNLAWKLACVLRGEAAPALLDSYDAERRPCGELAVEQAYNRYVLRADPDLGSAGVQPAVPDLHLEIGNRYRSSAICVEADAPDDGAPHIDPRQSRGLPGTRAPHVVLRRGTQTLSALDLFGRHFVLLSGPRGEGWQVAADHAARTLGVPLDVHRVGGAELVDEAGRFGAAYGIDDDGAVLVRPDGFVAWRRRDQPDDAAQQLLTACCAVLGR